MKKYFEGLNFGLLLQFVVACSCSKFYSFEDLIKQGKAYLERSDNIPMAVLGYLTPKEKRAELELLIA